MNKAIAILELFPDATIGEDFEVVDHLDGNGQVISKWELDSPLPSNEELELAWESYLNKQNEEPPPSEIDLLKQEVEVKKQEIDELKAKVDEMEKLNISTTEAIMEMSSVMASFYEPSEPNEPEENNVEQPVEGEENV